MAKPKDLTGQRFGLLTVLGLCPEPYISPSGKPTRRWKCRCDCGNEIVVLTNALTGKNGTRSCGCTRKEFLRGKAHDLSGRRFGRLTVLKSVELDVKMKNGLRRGWLCRCDCGNEIIATQKDLEHSGLKSCGCLLSDTAREKIRNNVMRHFDGTTISAIQPDRPPNKNNKSGVKGVYWSGRERKWVAKIGVKNKSITIGRFMSLEDAKKQDLTQRKNIFLHLLKHIMIPWSRPINTIPLQAATWPRRNCVTN